MCDEIEHRKKLSKTILFMEGIPSFGQIKPIQIITTLPEQLNYDLQLETQCIKDYDAAFHAFACDIQDATTAHILSNIAKEETQHARELEQFIKKIELEGIESV